MSVPLCCRSEPLGCGSEPLCRVSEPLCCGSEPLGCGSEQPGCGFVPVVFELKPLDSARVKKRIKAPQKMDGIGGFAHGRLIGNWNPES